MRLVTTDNDDEKDLKREVNPGIAKLTGSVWEDELPDFILDCPKLGLCETCDSLIGFVRKYGSVFARCDRFDRTLNPEDPITKCTEYKKRGAMSLEAMLRMATLIDVDNKQKVGF